jgi:hypothetical protein
MGDFKDIDQLAFYQEVVCDGCSNDDHHYCPIISAHKYYLQNVQHGGERRILDHFIPIDNHWASEQGEEYESLFPNGNCRLQQF